MGLKYVNWLTVGDLSHPQWLNPTTRAGLAKNLSQWQLDDVPGRMEQIDGLLNANNAGLPSVLYIHCEAGEREQSI